MMECILILIMDRKGYNECIGKYESMYITLEEVIKVHSASGQLKQFQILEADLHIAL